MGTGEMTNFYKTSISCRIGESNNERRLDVKGKRKGDHLDTGRV